MEFDCVSEKSIDIMMSRIRMPSINSNDRDSVFSDIGEVRADDCLSLSDTDSFPPEASECLSDSVSLNTAFLSECDSATSSKDNAPRFSFQRSSGYNFRERRIHFDYVRLKRKTESLRIKDQQLIKRHEQLRQKAEELMKTSSPPFVRGRCSSLPKGTHSYMVPTLNRFDRATNTNLSFKDDCEVNYFNRESKLRKAMRRKKLNVVESTSRDVLI